MPQHDYNIANQTGLNFRQDLNNALAAIVTDNSGNFEPSSTFPGMVWRDTSVSPSVLKKRNDADNAWVTILTAAGEAVSGASNAAGQRTALGLGTAATLNTASTAEAKAGTSNTVAITPLRLREGLNADGSAPIYACRAWVNFNGTGNVTVRASGNVSSITDNGVGTYVVNFSTAMPDGNYAAFVGTKVAYPAYQEQFIIPGLRTQAESKAAEYCNLWVSSQSTAVDVDMVDFSVFR